MKAKFTTLDIKLLVSELTKKLLGMKVVNIYDIDSKTYLFKFNRTDEKAMLLVESGIRFHTTEFDWPKSLIPSGFAMKLRKHVRGRRLESIQQLGVDRIIDLQFGSGEAAYHVILEVYDRGNIVLTDFEYNILNIQRPRTDDDKDVKFMVREKYPLELAKQHECVPSRESIMQILESAKKGDNLRKILNPHLVYGSNLLDHCLLEVGLKGTTKVGNGFQVDQDLDKLMEALNSAEEFMQHCCEGTHKGYIINQKEKKPDVLDTEEFVLTYSEFHPFLFKQHSNESYSEFESFDKAVDEFYSKIESQKQDRKIMQQKSTALKKLEHIKLDNQNRVQGLKEEQLIDMKKAWLIELNIDLVEEACAMIRNALAHKVDWTDLMKMIEEASSMSSVVASIASIKLETNVMTMLLSPPENMVEELDLSPMKVDINLGMSAYSNARQYYDLKKHATSKEIKTTDALQKAYKSVEKKTIKTLKDVQTIATINKARKTYWFEKFLWFISSENYIIIGGRDMQQNEMIVKRYLRPGDIYVHADLNGASSVIIKNPTKKPVPPVTLNEAGAMALCNSAAWDARVVTSSWWVHHDQVSKTAPSGEYLTTGSFMIRGKKNYLLPSNMIYGFGFLFKLDETCLEKHMNERRVKGINGEDEGVDDIKEHEEELVVEDDNNDDDDDVKEPTTPSCNKDLDTIEEVQEFQDEPDAFPDTKVKFNLDNTSNTEAHEDDEDEDKSRTKARVTAKQKRDAKKPNGENKGAKKEDKAVAKENSEQKPHKRLQKGKLKMIKKKYGDQDEEDRELKIKLLAADGAPKDKKSNKKDKENVKPENNQKTGNKKQEAMKKPVKDKIVSKPIQEDSAVMEEEPDDEGENKQIQQEMEVLNSLTGIPLPDDILHYCIPVCAPWNALKNYRFKVKLTPGTGKKGKAAKTAIGMFMQDKSTTSLEKDLLKSVKDSDLARNMPGKVKVSVAKIQK